MPRALNRVAGLCGVSYKQEFGMEKGKGIVYFGTCDNMVAEVAAFDWREIIPQAAYLIMVIDDTGLQYDTDYALTYEQALEDARGIVESVKDYDLKIAFV